jgi:hypothetical protein
MQCIPCAVVMSTGERGQWGLDLTTKYAMQAAGQCIASHRPDRVLVLAAHIPRPQRTWWMLVADWHPSELAAAAPRPQVRDSAIGELTLEMTRCRLPCLQHHAPALVRGTLSEPVRVLKEQGWAGPVSLLSPPLSVGPTDSAAVGRAIARAAESAGQRWALVVSGPSTHFDRRLWSLDASSAPWLHPSRDSVSGAAPRRRGRPTGGLVVPLTVAITAAGAAQGGRLLRSANEQSGSLVAVLHDIARPTARRTTLAHPVALPLHRALSDIDHWCGLP